MDGEWNGNHSVTECSDATFTSCGTGTSAGPIDDSGMIGNDSTWAKTFATAGTYYYYCFVHPTAMRGVVEVQAPPETTGPIASGVAASPDPTNGVAATTVTATIDDSTTGGSTIQAAEVFVDAVGAPGTGTSMTASDGTFDSVSEAVTGSASVSGLSLGIHNLYVLGQDSQGNWSAVAAAGTVDVTAVPAGVQSATVSISPGVLSVSTTPIEFGTIALSGVDQTLDTQPAAWSGSDGRGSGAGWIVSVSSTGFSESGGGIITVDNFKMQLLDANVVPVGGSGTPPTSQITSYQPLSAVPLAMLSAAEDEGMGTYDFTPDCRLIVPAATTPGDYEAFLTVNIVSGP